MKDQGLCPYGAIFLALPPPRERADALRRECEPYSATALQSKDESGLMVHHAKKPPLRVAFRLSGYQGLCPYGAIFLRAPTVSDLPSALLGMRTLFCNCVAEQG